MRKDPESGTASVRGATFEEIAKGKADALQEQPKQRAGMRALMHRTLRPNLSEIFFGNRVVLVEGAEDAAFITSYLHLKGRWDEFRRCGAHIVPTNGKSFLLEPLIVLHQLGIPAFVVFDSDGQELDSAKRALHDRDNSALLRALGEGTIEAFPSQTVWRKNFTQWKSCFADAVESDAGKDRWRRYQQAADKEWGQPGGIRKNPLHIATCIRLALEEGIAIPTLEELCTRILN